MNVLIPQIKAYLATQPVKKAWLFGSFARAEQSEQSDIDVLIDPDYDAMHTGLEFFELWDGLEQLTRRKVDLVTPNGLSKYVQPYVDADKVLIYEKG